MPYSDSPEDPFGLEQLPWPTDDADLRAPSNNDRENAIIGWRPPYEARVSGFRRAAEVLADSLMTNPTLEDLDTLVFPYITCWRHYTELHIKYLIAQLREFLRKESRRRGGHKIDQLWSELKPLLKEAKLDQNEEDRQARKSVTRLINQLARLDPSSQDFRYAERADGTPS